uniref:Uncharacterized protein n=1 Tax=Palpitomonas bilix TaxID=652834 RepID=A0A7S3LU15_9EUKA|mmetsp:Transcript_46666/g.120334  ORF Transcript_46666/g.120334 Transcript_46666/m.120334 type:complete len:177 (+) Transcript_46666:346-876(+)
MLIAKLQLHLLASAKDRLSLRTRKRSGLCLSTSSKTTTQNACIPLLSPTPHPQRNPPCLGGLLLAASPETVITSTDDGTTVTVNVGTCEYEYTLTKGSIGEMDSGTNFTPVERTALNAIRNEVGNIRAAFEALADHNGDGEGGNEGEGSGDNSASMIIAVIIAVIFLIVSLILAFF